MSKHKHPQVSAVERLTPGEMEYHRKLMMTFNSARAAVDSWSAHLAEAHGLKQGDQITEDGRIVRQG